MGKMRAKNSPMTGANVTAYVDVPPPVHAHRPEPVPGLPERDPFKEPQPDDIPGLPPGAEPGTGPLEDEPADRPLQ